MLSILITLKHCLKVYLPGQFRELGCSLDHWHCAMVWELLPFVAIGNDGKQRIDVAEPVRPLVPANILFLLCLRTLRIHCASC